MNGGDMTRDLGKKGYFRITIHELENLEPSDFVVFALPEGTLKVPVGVLAERFSTSKSWVGSGVHSSSIFPRWLAPYLQSKPEAQSSAHSAVSIEAAHVQHREYEQVVTRKSGATNSQRQVIRQALFGLVEQLSADLSLSPEAVVLEMRYFHQSATNPYRTNASKRDKNRSLKHHNYACQAPGCNASLSLDDAVFHHRRRGFSGQHEPENLLPYCEACHDTEHDVPAGKSLSKGSRN
jgi:hypothetical protein